MSMPECHAMHQEGLSAAAVDFNADAVAREVAAETAEVLRTVEVLEENRGPSEETLRTLICL
jgi:hypothetical protein